MVRSLGPAVLLACLGAGCAVTAPKPVAPSLTIPEGWQAAGQTTEIEGATAPEDLSRWWQRLGDPTLSDLVERSLAKNPDLRTARARVREARARRGLAGKDFLPDLTASVSASASRTSGSATADHYSAGFDASWEPDIFGATRHAVSAAEAELQATEASQHDAQVSLVAEVALAYVDLRALQARLSIAQGNLARQAETLELTSWRAQAGLTSDLDVEQARTNLEQTRAQIPSLEASRAGAEHRLAVLIGEPPTALRALLAPPGPIPTAPARLAVGIPADTLRQRPDVRAAERRLAAETARLGQARAALYPSLRLSGSIGIEALSLGALTSAETVVRSLLGGLTAPIFDRGKIRRRIEIQDAVQEQALATYESTVLTALQEVEDALVSLATTQERQQALASATQAARTAAELARKQYAAGLVGYQSVLDTERSLLSAEDGQKAAEADETTAVIRLYKALGGGFESRGSQPERKES